MDRRTRSDHQRASSYWHAPDTYSCNQARRKINNTPAPESTPKGGCTRAFQGTPPRRSTAARTPRVRPLGPNPRTQQYHHTHRQPAGLQGCVVMVSKTCSSNLFHCYRRVLRPCGRGTTEPVTSQGLAPCGSIGACVMDCLCMSAMRSSTRSLVLSLPCSLLPTMLPALRVSRGRFDPPRRTPPAHR